MLSSSKINKNENSIDSFLLLPSINHRKYPKNVDLSIYVSYVLITDFSSNNHFCIVCQMLTQMSYLEFLYRMRKENKLSNSSNNHFSRKQ